jgi:hypothetical protein
VSQRRGQRTHTPGSHVPSAAWQEHGVPGMTVAGIAQMPHCVEQTLIKAYG